MKRIQYIFTTILLLILLFIGETEVSAMNTFFSTQSLPGNDRKTLLEKCKYIYVGGRTAPKSN